MNRLQSKTSMVFTVALFSMLLTTSLVARRGGHGFAPGSQSNSSKVGNYERVYDALKYAQRASKELQAGKRFQAKINLTKVYFKAKIALITLKPQPKYAHVASALSLTIKKIAPESGLSIYEKVNWAADCLHEAVTAFISKSFRGPKAAKKHIQVSRLTMSSKDISKTVASLTQAKRFLGRNTYQAKEAIALTIEKLHDPYLTLQEKKVWFDDCLKVALQNL